MKKTLLILALFLLPLSLRAMTPMDDDELAAVSARTGVSILVDITMNIHIDCIAWGDSDGIGGTSYWSIGTSAPDTVLRTADISVAGGSMSPLLLDVLRRYRSFPGVSFFPEPLTMDVVDGLVRLR